MKIEHFGGSEHANDQDALNIVLKRRYGANANEFWLSADAPFPSLSILVRDDLASVHYFPEEGHPGYSLVGGQSELERGGSTIFFTNSPSEEIEIANEMIVPFSIALQVAHQFFASPTRPTSHTWYEL